MSSETTIQLLVALQILNLIVILIILWLHLK